MSGRPVIIDCDPGIDDAIALLLALASPEEIDLLGITCVAGNVPLPLTLRNARIVVELSGRTDVPIYAGCARPMRRTLSTGERIHGKTGLDGYDWPEPSLVIGDGHAVDFIVETCLAAKDGAITLCPVGPMTNIATAIVKQPRILPKLREIAFMGGAALVPGNVTPVAEFNIHADPHAAEVVLQSGVAEAEAEGRKREARLGVAAELGFLAWHLGELATDANAFAHLPVEAERLARFAGRMAGRLLGLARTVGLPRRRRGSFRPWRAAGPRRSACSPSRRDARRGSAPAPPDLRRGRPRTGAG